VTQPKASLRIRNSIREIERAAVWLDSLAASAQLPEAVTTRLHVALDEVLSNIIRHGFPGTACGSRTIRLGFRNASGQVELSVIDDGIPFDPTVAASPPPCLPLAERQPGGLGLLFVQSLMDEMRYSRFDGFNRLVLCKRLPAPAD
jgi:serine/threonine-protein kinase RsbW